jgi:hypothetical protein
VVANIGANFLLNGVPEPTPFVKRLAVVFVNPFVLYGDFDKFLSVKEAEIALEPAKNWPIGFFTVEFMLILGSLYNFFGLLLVLRLYDLLMVIFFPVNDLAEAKGVRPLLVKNYGHFELSIDD